MLDAVLHWLGLGLCHQIPARSFFGGTHQVPVCARDTGIYIGFVVSMALIVRLDRRRHSTELPRPAVLAIAAAFLLVMAWDGVTSYAGLRPTDNTLRLATGLLAGWALPVVVVPILNGELWRVSSATRVLDRRRDITLWLLPLPIVFAIVLFALPATGIVYSALVMLTVFATFTAVNTIVVCLAPPLERRAVSLVGTLLPVSLAFGLTLAEIAGAAVLRIQLLGLLGASAGMLAGM